MKGNVTAANASFSTASYLRLTDQKQSKSHTKFENIIWTFEVKRINKRRH